MIRFMRLFPFSFLFFFSLYYLVLCLMERYANQLYMMRFNLKLQGSAGQCKLERGTFNSRME